MKQGTCRRQFNDYVSCLEKDRSDKSGAGISTGEAVQFMVAAAKAANTKLSLEIQQQQMKLGQKRAFKVKLIGEGVNDYSGPYHETFSDDMAEFLKIEAGNCCSLSALDPTPNNASSIGKNHAKNITLIGKCSAGCWCR
jgi:hypothetical protein